MYKYMLLYKIYEFYIIKFSGGSYCVWLKRIAFLQTNESPLNSDF